MNMSAPKKGIKRIKMATISVPDINFFEECYVNWLDYKVVGKSTVDEYMCNSWGTPKLINSKFILLSPKSGEDVFIRAIENPLINQLHPFSYLGWNAIELVVSDVNLAYEKLRNSPFDIIGTPKIISPNSSIKAMQVLGPALEVLYLTSTNGDREHLNHPEPKCLFGRIFIVIMAVNNLEKNQTFYLEKMMLESQGNLNIPVDILSSAQKKNKDYNYNISVLSASERGNKIELDEYDTKYSFNKHILDNLSQGISMITFEVNEIEEFNLDFIDIPGEIYKGFKSAVFLGPNGERWELLSKIS
tara:strand:- start:1126 stop:2031 length:906 start_codon:yes stop_codon:yes gene_type:complete